MNSAAELARCPFEVERPVMLHRWESLTFLHWSFEPAVVQRLLPASLTVETIDERAWVGLVPFFMRVWLPLRRARPVPWLTEFCETNVRTYVRDGAGRSGIWFFSLDAARAGAVVTARSTYRLPYFWSKMSLTRAGNTIEYSCARRGPGSRGASSHQVIEIGAPYAPGELTAFDHLLTARWILFSRAGARQRFARAWHAPWPLRRATARVCDDELLPAAGLPASSDPPVVHFSEGVDVRIGRPER
ncbi:MAG TPA: DUF2071 domain-containing protein [Acidimicrobiia bacterium]|nr:DUF2071 domain-containing protein [Acidimicrobiia bacterium]